VTRDYSEMGSKHYKASFEGGFPRDIAAPDFMPHYE
jgi:hypothetical protein